MALYSWDKYDDESGNTTVWAAAGASVIKYQTRTYQGGQHHNPYHSL
jgi:hypothetical protein